MKINIYYGGRGLLDDPTLYVLGKMEDVLRELRVKVERYNIYEHKNEIATLPQTFKDADGDTYEIRRKYANIDGHVKSVYILQDLDGDIVDVFGLYELQHPESFGNSRLNLTISRIIKEVN